MNKRIGGKVYVVSGECKGLDKAVSKSCASLVNKITEKASVQQCLNVMRTLGRKRKVCVYL